MTRAREGATYVRRLGRTGVVVALAAAVVAALALTLGFRASDGEAVRVVAGASPAPSVGPTRSSPIVLSRDERFVWSVNPEDDSVSVIRTDRGQLVGNIPVGKEPRSVALDAGGEFAYVANAEDGTVTVIRIVESRPKKRFRVQIAKTITTGSEPWDIVVSPDNRKLFVANSGQDTVTVIDTATLNTVGYVDLRNSSCNDPDPNRHYQPRAMAITEDSRKLYVTRFFSTVKAGGRQGVDEGREAAVCRINIKPKSSNIRDYAVSSATKLQPQVTGFTIDSNGDAQPDPTSAFPNQLQAITIRGNYAYLPNIAASPTGPLKFNVDTHAFVNVIGNVNGRSGNQSDTSAAKFLNLHLGAREPEPGKKKLFFANAWAIDFTNETGQGFGYAVSMASDLLVKVIVRADGKLDFTVDQDTTRYIDLNDPANPATSGRNAGKKPIGIVINNAGTKAWVVNEVSRNVSVVDLATDTVSKVIETTKLPTPGSTEEAVLVGAEIFFSSRGHFNRPANAAVSTDERLSSEGWQACASCHFEGGTDSVVWQFATGPRKSVPLIGTFNPQNPDDQRVLNYSAIFDEVEDFEANIRNVSGPGALAAAIACQAPVGTTTTSTFDPAHGLIIGDNGDVNTPPCTVNNFPLKNQDRQQLTVTLPGSSTAVPAHTALRQWVQLGIRPFNGPTTKKNLPNAPTGVTTNRELQAGRALFQASCASCHFGGKWTLSRKDFASPPAATEFVSETNPAPAVAKPVGTTYLNRFLRDIGSYNLGVPGKGNDIGTNIGADELAAAALVNGVLTRQDGLGIDHNGDGKGTGFNVPSVLSIYNLPPYYHNGACETLACVVGNVKHRTANGTVADRLANPNDQLLLVKFLESISGSTAPF